ncbi:tetratricopeptide repeat protein [Burkholderia pseudomallei]|uniref:protein O-GlcNAc transferase n=1 Tax=Burkholderia pseudomallei TaxID=28450 RepID=A0A2K9DAI0_BURPE|nr:tetratricopeptide repeat protein [Burkholderia pseudomallei]AIP04749.1 tetratricopeptide repeat family protein [Burkholderia pseudomallei]AUG19493.1 glycosyltransferase [Burkholderia pseudomallei]EMP78038.1 hypothetical protein D512_00425 [Burkholderia pseudomallei MSHR1043]KGS19892.1 tetratricopeptide repeat family protein [Burkholderia pseudomallei MSHR4378]KGW29597.1 tetratricopeptide repeat family protein [Burkholderia pseudomallei MSHR2451]
MSESTTSDTLTPEQQFEEDIALVLKNAIELHHQGDFENARALYEAIVDAKPDHADAQYDLGVLKVQIGRAADALPHFEIALGGAPNNGQYWVSYVNALIDAGQIAAAWTALGLCQQRGVRGPAVDGLILRLAHSEEGKPAYIGTAAAAPEAAAPADAAANAAEPVRADARKPSEQDVRRFATLYNKRRMAEAIKFARALAQRYPGSGVAWKSLGFALHRDGQYGPACEALTKGAAMLPDDAECNTLYADTLRVLNRLADAEAQVRRVLDGTPDYAEAHRVLNMTLSARGRYQEAIEAGRRSVELAPNSVNAHGSLAVTLSDYGQTDEAEIHFRRAHELNPKDPMAYSNLLFCQSHKIDVSIRELFDAHRAFGELYEAPLRGATPKHANSRDPERRLRIGFVSGDLFLHAVSSYLLPLVDELAKDPSVSLHFYYTFAREDSVTERIRSYAQGWHMVMPLSDEQFAERVRHDRIDILVDLSGHSGRNRLPMFARKPAPIQVSWIGYPGTTGLEAIDYYLADPYAVPFGPMQAQFTEKIVHLSSGATFSPDGNAPPVNMLPALHNGHVSFGSFNRLNKLRGDVIAVWARIMRAVPGSRIVLGSIPKDGGGAAMIEWFEQEGIARERLSFQPRSVTAVYLQQHHHVDVCLDTFPYTGSTTVLNALWMGVPTLTMRGETLPSRAGLTWMSHVGLESFIADDIDDFVAKGIALASDIPALARIRGELRERCMRSPAFQPQRVAQDVSDAFRIMWRRWCDGQPPAPFAVPPRDAKTTVAGDRS